MAHQWSGAVYFFDDYQRKRAYTCMVCRRRIVREVDSVGGPMPDAHDYA